MHAVVPDLDSGTWWTVYRTDTCLPTLEAFCSLNEGNAFVLDRQAAYLYILSSNTAYQTI